jgi:hypothetical protein
MENKRLNALHIATLISLLNPCSVLSMEQTSNQPPVPQHVRAFGANRNADEKKAKEMHKAITAGQLALIYSFLDKDRSLANAHYNGMTPLQICRTRQPIDKEIEALLLAYGAQEVTIDAPGTNSNSSANNNNAIKSQNIFEQIVEHAFGPQNNLEEKLIRTICAGTREEVLQILADGAPIDEFVERTVIENRPDLLDIFFK